MYLKYLFILVCSFLLLPTGLVLAGVDVSVSGGYLAGNTQYQIGNRVVLADGSVYNLHFPLSELDFPLDSYVVKGQLDADFANKWVLMLRAETNLTDDSGKMEDSDWGVWDASPTDQLDIYSKSDTEMDMYAFEGKLTYQLYQGYYGENSLNSGNANSELKFSYTVGLGYKYQKFDFDISDLDQWYPSAPTAPHDTVEGLVATYEVEYQIPYLELGMKMSSSDKFVMELAVAYAPLVDFKEEDQHLLRNMVSPADHDWNGDALMAHLYARYNLNKSWFVKAEFETMKIESEGRSKTYVNGIYDHSIDHEISSRQHRYYLTLGYSF